jgi:hypothetical protein
LLFLQYWYELFLDDLPMWGMVGEVLRDDAHSRMEKHIFTHRSLNIAYSGHIYVYIYECICICIYDDAHSRMEKHIFTHRSLNIAYSGIPFPSYYIQASYNIMRYYIFSRPFIYNFLLKNSSVYSNLCIIFLDLLYSFTHAFFRTSLCA